MDNKVPDVHVYGKRISATETHLESTDHEDRVRVPLGGGWEGGGGGGGWKTETTITIMILKDAIGDCSLFTAPCTVSNRGDAWFNG